MAKICKHCGCTCEDRFTYCDKCGAPLDGDIDKRDKDEWRMNNEAKGRGGINYVSHVKGQESQCVIAMVSALTSMITPLFGIIWTACIWCMNEEYKEDAINGTIVGTVAHCVVLLFCLFVYMFAK